MKGAEPGTVRLRTKGRSRYTCARLKGRSQYSCARLKGRSRYTCARRG
ncbi:unnamed protein product [Staurois parvus]|uniref:Uncharacterized protein n=1 Tax=Staurois parvus TaxID=386267 RepID=A0ABN9C3S2_9NEOB|nr:unnamed protein product [Staurois parvus]